LKKVNGCGFIVLEPDADNVLVVDMLTDAEQCSRNGGKDQAEHGCPQGQGALHPPGNGEEGGKGGRGWWLGKRRRSMVPVKML